MNDTAKFVKGAILRASDPDFLNGLAAVVDYRGDSLIQLESGQEIEGYVFSASQAGVDLYPKNSSSKTFIPLPQIKHILFSGENTALGKSWADWTAKKKAEQSTKSVEQG